MPNGRRPALRARVIRPDGALLVAFHVDTAELGVEQLHHLSQWFDRPVSLDAHFLAPEDVTAELEQAGFAVWSHTLRQPDPAIEYPSRRCYLLARKAVKSKGEDPLGPPKNRER